MLTAAIHGAQDAGATDRPSMGEAERHLSGSESWEPYDFTLRGMETETHNQKLADADHSLVVAGGKGAGAGRGGSRGRGRGAEGDRPGASTRCNIRTTCC